MLISNLGTKETYSIAHIRILAPAEPDAPYPVELSLPEWRAFDQVFLTLDLATLAQELEPRAYGEALGRLLFADNVLGKHYHETLAAVRGRGEGLHVRLECNLPELHAVHWERILHQLDGEWIPLGSTAISPFSRYIPARQWDRPLPIAQRPLRILAIIAAPDDLNDYGLDPIAAQEREALHTLLDALPETEVTYLESKTANLPTLTNLRDGLGDGFHIVHMLCHGASLPTDTVLYLEHDNGAVDPVEGARLVEAFKVCQQPPALCFLAACESAKRTSSDAFVPLGPALVEDGGVQAVVAMSARVGQQTARQFSQQFYDRLLAHGIVDLATNQARAMVQDQWDWGAPVLFSRLPDNQLIDFPIGERYNMYFVPANKAAETADRAREMVRLEGHGAALVAELEEVIKELGKSHKIVVDLASSFRSTGEDPATFAAKFAEYYPGFKAYYDHEAWEDESTSCSKIDQLRMLVMPKLSKLLDRQTWQDLDQQLAAMNETDWQLIDFLREFVESMNTTVEQIKVLLRAGKIDEAIARKIDFEAKISPSFRRSKEMRKHMGDRTGYIAAC